MKNKHLGIDYGAKKVGIAITDEIPFLAREYKILYHDQSPETIIYEIQKIIEMENIQKVVLGIPYSLNGESSLQTEEVYAFYKMLKKTISQEIILADERMSTKMAKAQMPKIKKKKDDDARAAMIVLQFYIDSL